MIREGKIQTGLLRVKCLSNAGQQVGRLALRAFGIGNEVRCSCGEPWMSERLLGGRTLALVDCKT